MKKGAKYPIVYNNSDYYANCFFVHIEIAYRKITFGVSFGLSDFPPPAALSNN